MIRTATRADVPTIVRFICELADYERLRGEVEIDERALGEHLFGPEPVCSALIAEDDGRPVGFALWFVSYSTFKMRPCLWLEDLYVVPQARGRGHGKALLRHLARIAVERGHARFDWAVLEWNEPSIRFYREIGARMLTDWRICRLDGAALRKLGS
jgi:GNAT superfamily N-acetyltransferase